MGKLAISKVEGPFADRYHAVGVYRISDGGGFNAFAYSCRLNLDIDGALTAYGYDNPTAKNNLGGDNVQKNLDPLESWHKGAKGVSNAYSQKAGLGNACGDPGDGTKGWKNFIAGNRKFYWAGVKALTKTQAGKTYVIDTRDELEAGYGQNHWGYFKKNKSLPAILPKGSGFFPVVQTEGDGKGYFISTTSAVADGNASAFDAAHYLDARTVPYAVWANAWLSVNVAGKILELGDFGIAVRSRAGVSIPYVYGDSGTPNKVGECSLKLHNTMGGTSELVTFIAFPGSGSGKVLGKNPLTTIQQGVKARGSTLGANANDLAVFLATGLANPKDPPKMNALQQTLYNSFVAALKF